MAESNRCPECGAELPTDETQGLCPKCLMGAGFGSETEPPPSDRSQPGRFTPPEAESLAQCFPQLDILELLGHGGMGAVYKARQKKLDRLVALKIIRPESAVDPAFAERFNREAKMLARLNHPHIVGVHDFGEVAFAGTENDGADSTLYFFLMEYVDGANLRQLMTSQELAPEQALAIVPQICEALQFAHDEGVVHRDIKPENILIDSKGSVKIADFGLAKLAERNAEDFTLTGTHQVMGTPRYMAPEQMEGSHTVDRRADIYSLGVVFYEMLTGQVPAGHFEPPSKKVEIDVRLDDVVLRSLAREPERRYQEVSEVKTDVESITRHSDRQTLHSAHEARELGVRHIGDNSEESLTRETAIVWRQLQTPSNWLLATSIVNWVGIPLGAAIIALLIWQFGSQRMVQDEDTWTAFANCIFLLPLNALIMVAALKLKRLQTYWLGIVGSALALLIPPGLLIGIPVGVWVLVLLINRRVRHAFSHVRTSDISLDPRYDHDVGSEKNAGESTQDSDLID